VTILAITTAVILFGLSPLLASDKTVEVVADSMSALPDGTIKAEGNVVIRGEGVSARADLMTYDTERDLIVLSGGVSMKDRDGGIFTGESLELDIKDMTGGVSAGEIRVGTSGIIIRGENIRRMSSEEYSIERGMITSCQESCPDDRPDWSFNASGIKVRRKGYLTARNATFRIEGVPVFYTPYLIYPVMTDRKTGLLIPDLSFSEETGMETALPLYIVLGRYADMTLTTRMFSRDSAGFNGEVRYRLDHGGGGDLQGFTMAREDDRRWYYSGEHANAITSNVWLRGRWADTGEPGTPSQFGQDFQQRYPGLSARHLTVEGGNRPVRMWAAFSSLVADVSRSRDDPAFPRLDTNEAGIFLGPLILGGVSGGVDIGYSRYENNNTRLLTTPWADVLIKGPSLLRGRIWWKQLMSNGGEGSSDDHANLFGIEERLKMMSNGSWGRHDIEIVAALMRSEEANFSKGAARDAEDIIEKRALLTTSLESVLSTGDIKWDLDVGYWQDEELDMQRHFESTRIQYKIAYLEASRNRDAQLGMILPSTLTTVSSPKGWAVEAGVYSESASIALGKESTDGSPDILSASGHVKIGYVGLSGESYYDMDEDKISDETLSVLYDKSCWSINITRARNPDRTDWKVRFALVI